MIGNIDPDTLPISDALKVELAQWARRYDETLNRDDPASSGFPSVEAKIAFNSIGLQLADMLRNELGKNFEVILQL